MIDLIERFGFDGDVIDRSRGQMLLSVYNVLHHAVETRLLMAERLGPARDVGELTREMFLDPSNQAEGPSAHFSTGDYNSVLRSKAAAGVARGGPVAGIEDFSTSVNPPSCRICGARAHQRLSCGGSSRGRSVDSAGDTDQKRARSRDPSTESASACGSERNGRRRRWSTCSAASGN